MPIFQAPNSNGFWTTWPARANKRNMANCVWHGRQLADLAAHGRHRLAPAQAVHATDVSNASRTMLFNVHNNQWDAELMGLLEIPAIPDARSAALER